MFEFSIINSYFQPELIDRLELEQNQPPFCAHQYSRKLHHVSCDWAQEMDDSNKVEYNSLKDAYFSDGGYIPCKCCLSVSGNWKDIADKAWFVRYVPNKSVNFSLNNEESSNRSLQNTVF